MRKTLAVLAAMIVLALAASHAEAVKTENWKTAGPESLMAGELRSVSVAPRGQLRLAPAHTELAKPSCLFLWSLAEDSQGNIYLGTGPNGVIYKLDKAGKLVEFAPTNELNVHCLAVDAKDNLYAGTSPHGLVYKITPQGAASVFCQTAAGYVWALAFDDKGNLLAATGKDGSVLSITPGGQSKVLFRTKETHVLCLAIDAGRGVFAGTAPSGLVYHVDPNGAAAVLYDAEEGEVHAVIPDGHGCVYAATASGAPGSDQPPPTPTPTPTPPPAPGPQPSEPPGGAGGNSLYQIDLISGRVLSVADLGPMNTFSAALLDGSVYLATGDQGRLLRFQPKIGLELLLVRPEKQMLSLLITKSGHLVAGTGNGATVLAVSSTFSASGTFTSTALDSKFGASWGLLSWHGDAPEGTQIAFATRAGNVATPDATWSDWKDIVFVPAQVGKAGLEGRVLSPRARFLQYRATLTTADSDQHSGPHSHQSSGAHSARSPSFDEVTVSYQPANMPPVCQEFKLGEGRAPQGQGPPRPPGPAAAAGSEAGAERMTAFPLTWVVSDPNDDTLRYDLFIRMVGDKRWEPLAENLTLPQYQWNTLDAPDGAYNLLLRASDAPGNPPADAMQVEKISEIVVVDNTPPRVEAISAKDTGKRTTQLRAVAVDDTSDIAKIELRVDKDPWAFVVPDDGILDTRREAFSFESGPLAPGEHSVYVRVTDAKSNVTTARSVVTVTEP